MFSLIGLQEYFYDQVFEIMRILGMVFYLSILRVVINQLQLFSDEKMIVG